MRYHKVVDYNNKSSLVPNEMKVQYKYGKWVEGEKDSGLLVFIDFETALEFKRACQKYMKEKFLKILPCKIEGRNKLSKVFINSILAQKVMIEKE